METKNEIELFDAKALGDKLTAGELTYAEKIKEIEIVKKRLDTISLDNIEVYLPSSKVLMDEVWDIKQKSLVKTRTLAKKEGEELRRPVNELSTKIKTVYDKFITEVEKVENHPTILKLAELYKKIEDDKQAEILAKQKDIEDKIQKVLNAGLVLNIENLYYENDAGIACTRGDIQNMSKEQFETLLEKANARKLELEEEAEIERQRINLIDARFTKLYEIGLAKVNDTLVMYNNEEGTNEEIAISKIEKCDNAHFEDTAAYFNDLKENNKQFLIAQQKIKQEQEAEKSRQEQEKRDIEVKLAKMEALQIELWQNMLKTELGANYSFKYQDPIKQSLFVFQAVKTTTKLLVDDCFKDDNAITEFIAHAKSVFTEEQAAEKLAQEKIIEEQEKIETERLKQESEKRLSVWNERIKILKSLGALENENAELYFRIPNVLIKKEDLISMTDDFFATTLEDISIATKRIETETKNKEKAQDDLKKIDEYLKELTELNDKKITANLTFLKSDFEYFAHQIRQNTIFLTQKIEHLR